MVRGHFLFTLPVRADSAATNVGRRANAQAPTALATGLFLLLALLLVSAARADEATSTDESPSKSAPTIYTQHCVACHAAMTGGDGHVLYQRDDRLARDFDALYRRVNFCQTSLGLSWSATQVKQISDYLNRLYYRYPTPKRAR